MAELVVTVALETIIDLLSEEAKFLFGVKDQVEELRGELEALEGFLKDANARKHEDERLRICVSQATLLAYRAEDVIEEYVIKVASKRGRGFRKAARRVGGIVGEGIAIHEVGNEIGKINKEIANLVRRLEGYGINRIIEAPPSPATIEKQRRQRTTYAHEVDDYFVGMEDDVSKIVTWVTEDDKIRRVISICGMGGLGKTTIARKVYHHRQVQRSFECFAWVSITQQCQVKMLLKDILIQIQILDDKGRDKIRDMEEDELVRELNNVLKTKKCFVVLDDIWEINDWRSLHKAFPTSEGSSKILLTTRKREVAKVAHLRHEPTLLDEEDGWDLLTKIAFNLQEEQPNESSIAVESVKSVGRDILRKCGGLPLAISALGGILRWKDTLIEWETVNNKFGTYVKENGEIEEVLAFSYDDLPSYVRPCFLYMGGFIEGEDIDVTRLYQLWMAEGLIPSMDIASDFFEELISRNMVQLKRNDKTDEMSCRLHDLVRELCLTKGREEQFLKILICDGIESIIDLEKSTTRDTYFRTLIFINQEQNFYLQGSIMFKNLRSLILDNCRIKNKKFPKEIRDMVQLRCLSLQNSLSKSKLPSFIGELQYLQTLNLAGNYLQLPNIFHKMKKLRCLYLPDSRRHSKFARRLEFHGLKELEVVKGLDSKYHKFSLSEFNNIRRFSARIRGYEHLSTILEKVPSLLEKASITYFSEESKSESKVKKLLLFPHLYNLVLNDPIEKFPRYEPQFWPDLVYLSLSDTKFEEDPMPFLQELPNLRKLTMYKAFVGKEMYCSSNAFPKLTSLVIEDLENIEVWRVDAGAFPNLSALFVWDCKSLKEIVPDGLTSITSLTRIDMGYGMPEEFRIKYGRVQNTNR